MKHDMTGNIYIKHTKYIWKNKTSSACDLNFSSCFKLLTSHDYPWQELIKNISSVI